MKTFAAFLALAAAVRALSGVSHDGHNLMLRHRQLAERKTSIKAGAGPSTRRGFYRVVKRKTPGTGDATTQPANTAAGTFGADQGCAVWHTVSDGEVCLGLIDKSSATFTMTEFLKFNPSLNSDCSNLETGTAYCVDTVAGAASAGKQASGSLAVSETPVATAPRVATVQTSDSTDAEEEDCEDGDDTSEPAASTSTSDDSEDCEDEAEAEDEPDTEDCEDEDSSDADTSSASSTADNSSSDNASSNDTSATVSVKVGKKPAAQPAETTTSSSNSSEATPDTSSKKNSSSSSSSSANVNLEFSGVATYYTQNGNAGNCGQVNPDSAAIVALYTPQYENGANCGKKVKLVNKANGNSIVATVADSCPSCQTNGNIDLSTSVFSSLSDGNMGLGVLNVEWGYI